MRVRDVTHVTQKRVFPIVTGTLLTTEAFGPLLLKSPSTPQRIINVSSGAGSITRRLDPTSTMYSTSAVHYRASKAAMNMITADAAVLWGEKGVRVFAVCPGFTESGLSGFNTVEMGAKVSSLCVWWAGEMGC